MASARGKNRALSKTRVRVAFARVAKQTSAQSAVVAKLRAWVHTMNREGVGQRKGRVVEFP
jgi:hypothetical protein